jgi:hypothetical protein
MSACLALGAAEADDYATARRPFALSLGFEAGCFAHFGKYQSVLSRQILYKTSSATGIAELKNSCI